MARHSMFPHLVVALALCVSAPARAQDDSLCSFNWYGNDNCNKDAVVKGCWSESSGGATEVVPSNVTRIDEEGLRLCLENPSVGTDVVYIMDLSASMLPSFNLGAGDPYGVRPEALDTAFSYQLRAMPDSRAGYIGFSGDVVTKGWHAGYDDTAKYDHVLEPLTVKGNEQRLNTMVDNLRNHMEQNIQLGGTNYQAALGRAVEWFQDDTKTPHENQAIVFLSDGDPCCPKGGADVVASPSQIDYLTANDIPVYGVFLYDRDYTTLADTLNALDTLVRNTGGSYHILETDSSHKLGTVLESIVKDILTEYTLSGVTVTSGGLHGSADSIRQDTSGVWAATLDRFLPVGSRNSNVDVQAVFTATDKPDSMVSFSFTLDPSAPAQPGSPCYVCRPRSTVEVSPAELGAGNSTFTVTLNYYGDDTLSSVDIRLTTATKGDRETIAVTDYTMSGNRQIFETAVAFAVTPDAASAGDNTVQADSTDKMRVYWQHPVDSRDTAQKIVPVETPYGPYVVKALFYLGDPHGEDPAAKDTLKVIFHEALDCGDLGNQDPAGSFNYLPDTKSETDVFPAAGFQSECPTGGHDSVVTIVLDHTGLIVPGSDSLQARANAFFDRQDNPTELRPAGPVIWGRGYDWIMRGSPNPFQPGNEDHDVPEEILTKIDMNDPVAPSEKPPENAAVLEITSIKGVDPAASTVKIYDALGNLVRDGLPVYPRSDNNSKFYIFWDGYNRNNRRCGTGTYLAVLSIRERNEGAADIRRHKIAIVNGKTQ